MANKVTVVGPAGKVVIWDNALPTYLKKGYTLLEGECVRDPADDPTTAAPETSEAAESVTAEE